METTMKSLKSKEVIKVMLVFLFFLIGVVLPSLSSIRKESQKIVNSQLYDLDLVDEITKGVKLEEDIYVPGRINKYGLMFATYDRKNKGHIKIEILQGNVKLREIIDVSKIKNNQYHYLGLNFKKLKRGQARLIIEGVDGEKGNSVSMQRTSDIIYGELIQNGNLTGKSLSHNIIFYEINSTIKGQIIFFIISMILFFYGISLTKTEEKNNKKLYIVTVLLVYTLISVKAPTLTFKAEPFAEQIFNFLDNGRNLSFWKNLYTMDAGYLPLFQRIVGLLIIKTRLNVRIVSFLMSNISILIIGLMVSVFTLNNYRKYGERSYRFLMSLIFGVFNILSASYIETHVFIDFGYMNLFLLFFITLLDFEKIKRSKFISLMGLVFLLSLSKPQTIILLPLCIILLILLKKIIQKREKIFIVTISLASLIQTIYIYMNMRIWIKGDEPKVTILKIFNVGTHQVVQQFINLFYPGMAEPNQDIFNMNMLFLILLILLITICLFLFYKNKDKDSLLLLVLLGIIFGSSYFNVITRMWDGEDVWTQMLGARNNRYAALIKISFILIFLLLPTCIKKLDILKKRKFSLYKLKFNYFFSFVVFFLTVRYSPKITNDIYRYDDIFSDWKIYSKFYETGEYTIPIEPYIRQVNQNLYYIGSTSKPPSVMIPSSEKKYYLKNLENVEKIEELVLPKLMKVEYLYVRRVRNYNFDKVKLLCFDEKNNIISETMQLNTRNKGSIGFKIEKPTKIAKIAFFTEHGRKAYMLPEIVIGETIK